MITMKPLWMSSFLICLIALVGYSESVIINGSHLRSLTCFGINSTEEHCRVLARAVTIPDRLLDIYKNEKPKVRTSLDVGDLSSLNGNDLVAMHPILLLFIPSGELSQVEGDKLALLLNFWQHEKAIVRHIISTVSLQESLTKFFKRVESSQLNNDVLSMIGEELITDFNPRTIGPVLPHISLDHLYNLTGSKRSKTLFFCKPAVLDRKLWRSKSQVIKRIWAKLMIEGEYPAPLQEWTDSNVATLGSALVGAKPSELEQINGNKISYKLKLLHLPFSTLQIRSIFTNLYKNLRFTRRDFKDLEEFLERLLPSQLQMLPYKVTDFKNLNIEPAARSMATSNQILEYILEELKGSLPYGIEFMKRDDLIKFGQMVKLLPINTLMDYRYNPLDIEKLLPLQSDSLTKVQVYYMLGKGKDLNVTSEEIIQSCFSYLNALPASEITKEMAPAVVSHLALHMPMDNMPRLVKFLYDTSPILGSGEVMLGLLENPHRLVMLEYLPTRLLISRSKKLAQYLSMMGSEFSSIYSALPKKMASLMYRDTKNNTDNALGEPESFLSNLLYSFNCKDIEDLQVPDFIWTISKMRNLYSLLSQEFPKEMQDCAGNKLVEYLKLKSYITQQYSGDTLNDLLTPADIEAVGGWILLKMSVDDIMRSEYKRNIVQQIGKLSLSELLAAAPLSKIKDVIYVYMLDSNHTLEAKELSTLGNLTLLLDEMFITNIKQEIFQILLEGNYFDRRLCGTKSQRNAWKDIIINIYGSPSNWKGEDIVILGDLLIALTEKELTEINKEAWILVADLLKTRYFDPVQHHTHITFHEMCESVLPPDETESYTSDIKTMIRFYLKAAEYQLETVEPIHSDDYNEAFGLASNSLENESDLHNFNTEDPNKDIFDFIEDEILSIITANAEVKESTTKYKFTNKNTTPLEESTFESSTYTVTEPDSPASESSETIALEDLEFNDIKTSNQNDYPCGNEVLNAQCHSATSTTEEIAMSEESTSHDDALETTTQLEIVRIGDAVLQPIKNLSLSNQQPTKVKLLDLLGDEDEEHIYGDLTEAWKSVEDERLTDEVDYDENDYLIEAKNSDYFNRNRESHDDFKDSKSMNVKEDKKVYSNLAQAMNAVNLDDSDKDQLDYEDHTSEFLIPISETDDVNPVKSVTNFSQLLDKGDRSESNNMKSKIANERNLDILLHKKERFTRSIVEALNKDSCDVIKTVGVPAALVITKEMIKEMSDSEVKDCLEVFASMKLSKHIQKEILNRLEKEDIQLQGQIVKAAQVEDLRNTEFNMSSPWGLENIHAISRFTQYHSVGTYVAQHAMKKKKQLRIEEAAALGKLLCLIPDLNTALSPPIFLRASVVLGVSLTCNLSCLNTLAKIAVNDEAFGNPEQWSAYDVTDLGIIVAGLDTNNWDILVQKNSNALYGLEKSAGDCLPETHIQSVPDTSLKKIPYFTRMLMLSKLNASSSSYRSREHLLHTDISLNLTQIQSSASKTTLSTLFLFICFVMLLF